MNKIHYYLSALCLSATVAASLAGKAENSPAPAVVSDLPSVPAGRQTPDSNRQPQRQPAVNNRPGVQPARPADNVRSPAADNRPTAAVQRQPERAHVVAETRASLPRRPNSRVILSSPRQMPTTPLPRTVSLDRRCAAYNPVMLRAYMIAPRGNVIELVDGSVWHVQKKKDRRKVRSWTLWDSVVIESSQFLGWPSYSLVNYTRGESVGVTMTQGSIYEGHASHWVTQVDPARRILVLEDGSRWSFVEASFGDWREEDAVVLGLSKDAGGQYVYMLINTRTLKHSLAINIR